jgi:hypothetical protein
MDGYRFFACVHPVLGINIYPTSGSNHTIFTGIFLWIISFCFDHIFSDLKIVWPILYFVWIGIYILSLNIDIGIQVGN